MHEEFASIKADRSTRRPQRLLDFQKKLASLKFLDPACGCGNFLVIAYRELRRLELEVIRLRHNLDAKDAAQELPYGEVAKLSLVDVDQFHGIEIDPWPARIADHQMNRELSDAVGNVFQRIPLRKSPQIRCANALRFDWNELLPASECSYVLGNPPFVGAKFQDASQKADAVTVAGDVPNVGLLDYVTMWYFKAVRYIDRFPIRCAFVSTNSISQGEQVGVLWSELFKHGVKIDFAHRTFSWQSEARGPAHVHVVIIGFGIGDREPKRLFDYQNIRGEPTEHLVSHINPYLVDASDVLLQRRSEPICNVPKMGTGNKPIDDGQYLFTPEEKCAFLKNEPSAEPFFKRWLGGEEFINGIERWCLCLSSCDPHQLRNMPKVLERVEAVRKFRASSKSLPTQKIAATPTRFHTEFIPKADFIALPQVSSERRAFIPTAFLTPEYLCGDKLRVIEDAGLYHFGIMCSTMHMAWTRQVCGRLESRYQYSALIVYNNYPWPVDATSAQKDAVSEKAQGVLDARQPYLDKGSTLADLYDPLTMPADLLKAHQALDRAVDRCYRREGFESERQRVEYLFQLYEKLTAPLALTAKPKRGKRSQ